MGELRVACTATSGATGARLGVDAFAEIELEDLELYATLVADLTVDESTHHQVQPAQGPLRTQRVRWKVEINGSEVENVLPSISLDRSLDRSMQQGSFSLWAADSPSSVGAQPFMGVPATGLDRITISLEFEADDGTRFSEPIITDGIASTSTRKVTQAEGVVTEYGVLDEHYLWVNVPVTYQLPAGHNKQRRQVIRELLQEAGVDNIAISELDQRMLKPVDIARGDWLSMANALAEVDGARILRDRHNRTVTRFDAPERVRPAPRWVFGPDDIVASVNGQPLSIDFEVAEEAATRVSLRGAEQIASESCTQTTEEISTVARSAASIPALQWRQNGNQATEDIVPSGAQDLPADVVPPRRIAETITRLTKECGDVVVEQRETFALVMLGHWRFRHNGSNKSAPINLYSQCFLENDATGDLQEQAFFRPLPLWRQSGKFTKTRRYDDDGFLVSETEESETLYQRKQYVKQRSDRGDAWDVQTGPAEWFNDGLGNAVADTTEILQPTSVKVITWRRGPTDQAEWRLTEEYAFHKNAGFQYLYGDGSESDDAIEELKLVSSVLESWQILSEDRVVRTAYTQKVDEALSVETETLLGSAPAVPRRSSSEPTLADFDGDAEALADALAADRFDQRQLRAECDLTFLETYRPRRDVSEQFVEWVENEDELAAYCKRTAYFQVSDQVTFTVLAQPRVEEGDLVHAYGSPGSGFNVMGTVVTVQHSGSLPVLTTVTLAVYPESLALSVDVTEDT